MAGNEVYGRLNLIESDIAVIKTQLAEVIENYNVLAQRQTEITRDVAKLVDILDRLTEGLTS